MNKYIIFTVIDDLRTSFDFFSRKSLSNRNYVIMHYSFYTGKSGWLFITKQKYSG